MQYLVEHGANVNHENTPLIAAVLASEKDVVRYLASLPAVDLNARSRNGLTALEIARQNDETDIVRILENAKRSR